MLEAIVKHFKQHPNDSEMRSLKASSSALESTFHLSEQHCYQGLTAPCVGLFKRETTLSLN